MQSSKRPAGRPEVIVDLRPVGVLLKHDHRVRPVGAPLGHNRPNEEVQVAAKHLEDEVQVAAEQEAGRLEVIVDHLRPAGFLLDHDRRRPPRQ